MSISVDCDCGRQLRVKDALAGKRIRCPDCGGVVSVPNTAAKASTQPRKPKRRPSKVAAASPSPPPKPQRRNSKKNKTPSRTGKSGPNVGLMLGAAAVAVAAIGIVYVVLPLLSGSGEIEEAIGATGPMSQQEPAPADPNDPMTALGFSTSVRNIVPPQPDNIMVVILGLNRDRADDVRSQLKKLTSAGGYKSASRSDYLSVELLGVSDVAALEPLINFGAVIHLDTDRRMIYVDAKQPPAPSNVTGNTGASSGTSQAVALQGKTVGGVSLVVRSGLGDQVQFLCPEPFTVMTAEQRRLKYPSDRAPQLIYTNESGSVNFALNHTQDKVGLRELPLFALKMESILKPNASEWFGTKPRTIVGRKWVTFEFQSAAVDTQIRNIMACTSLDNRLLFFSFNTTAEQESQWLPVGQAVIDSLRVDGE